MTVNSEKMKINYIYSTTQTFYAHSAHYILIPVQKKLKELELKKIVYVDDYGQINKSLTKKYRTDYICPDIKNMQNKVLRLIKIEYNNN